MHLVEIENLSKTFHLHILNGKQLRALSNIKLTLQEGEIIGLTGKSGSGKSSLMKCIYRTYLASSGTILYHARTGVIDLVSATDHEIIALRKSEITYCSQFLSVIPRVSAIHVVGERLLAGGTPYDQATGEARDLLAKLGLPEELWDAYPVTFSGGEQQRINVARAIISKPRFLLIDEPTASLDVKTKDIVIELILGLKKSGTTVLCISHDEYTLDRITDRKVHLEFGEIKEPSLQH